ncbi:hypothetical protein E4U19_004590 [Claviceps sp. Clav32 group G5]|nr:hypothetical protein E4U19_004590 [Claviceps sp. Clav32 group G5]
MITRRGIHKAIGSPSILHFLTLTTTALLPLPLHLNFGTTHPRSKEKFQLLVEAFQPSLLLNFFLQPHESKSKRHQNA